MSLARRLTTIGSALAAAAAGLIPCAPGASAVPTLPTATAPSKPTFTIPHITIHFPTTTKPTIKFPPISIHFPTTTVPGKNPGTKATQETAPPKTAAPTPAIASCAYRRDLLVSTTDLTPRLAELGLREPTGDDVANLDEAALLLMHQRHLFPYALAADGDPLAIAATLASSKVVAAPVLMVIPATQWGFGAANPPTDLGQPAPDVAGGLAKPKQVAVLDTGFNSAPTDPAWMKARVRAATGFDSDMTSPTVNGHGKFVASLIAQEHPNSQITVAAAAPVALDRFTANDGLPIPSVITDGSDELQLFLAMQRLLGAGANFDVLNVSLGAYACANGNSGLVTQAAMIAWYGATKNKPVAAAAGNHEVLADPAAKPEPVQPFLPAGLARVKNNGLVPAFEPSLCDGQPGCKPGKLYDVQSLDAAGQPSAFTNPGRISAMGEHLVGVRLVDGTASSWSGTSMSTAIVAAALANGAQLGEGAAVAAQHVQAQ